MTSSATPIPSLSVGADSDASSNADNRTELVIAIVALIISVMAMVITTFQALQQFFSSATGQSSCGKRVIGKWAEFTKLHFRTFRIEVRFRVPVLFVAPPNNLRGPLGHAKDITIHYMTGSAESLALTHTWSPDEFRNRETTQESIRTADNELATWIPLMMALQRMEKESREWQQEVFLSYPVPVEQGCGHTLAVGVQEKVRSWDTMPDGLLKPYATSTIAHIVEMLAMLGIHWREFDRNNDKYRAQGNGFSVSGSLVPNLGIGFTFQTVGKAKFEHQRLVPNNLVKELCFGFCPTIFRFMSPYTDELDKKILQLGTPAELAETLGSFGCNTNTVNYFRTGGSGTRHSHLFPVPFEMIGMVGAVLQIKGTAFTMLPNPTFLAWDESSFSLPLLLTCFYDIMRNESGTSAQLHTILQHMRHVQSAEKDDADSRRQVKKRDADKAQASAVVVESVLNGTGTVQPLLLSSRVPTLKRIRTAFSRRTQSTIPKEPEKKSALLVYSDIPFRRYLDTLHEAVEMCDAFLAKPEIAPVVSHVFCLHIQEVLKYLNSHESMSDLSGAENNDASRDRLDAASSDDKHSLLAKVYVDSIRRRVLRLWTPFGAEESDTEESSSSVMSANELTVEDIDSVWRTLVFRMLCWLMLHNFHKKDIQMSRSDLFDSRMPVYIL